MSDRKYRHRGYQDDGGGFSSNGSSGGKREYTPQEPRRERLEGAPRGRTAGGFGPEVFKCARCGTAQHDFGDISVEAVCQCGADLHSCINCCHFDTTKLWECRAEIKERVSGKDKGNECPEFSPKLIADLSADKRSRPSSADDARKAFEDLFKK